MDKEKIVKNIEEIVDLLDISPQYKSIENKDIDYAWYVGAQNEDNDFSDIFINENRWENFSAPESYTDKVNEIKVGDKIALKAIYTKKRNLPFNSHDNHVGVLGIKAIGIVTENFFDGKNIKVAWTKLEQIKEWYGAPGSGLRKTIHNIKSSDSDKKALLDFTFNNIPQDYSILEDLYSNNSEPEIIDVIDYEQIYPSDAYRNKIYFGAPGTGKSWQLNKDKQDLLKEEYANNFERVTFHSDYSYSNFVGTYKPVPEKDEKGNDTITYKYVPGPFMRVLAKALKSIANQNPQPYLLIVEEINRANVAAVFGDVFQLLDRNDKNSSEYEISTTNDMRTYLKEEHGLDVETIRIPSNMFIWATMNSADQGVFPMDTAFKRRWDFEYIGIDNNQEKMEDCYISVNINGEQKDIKWNSIRNAINDFLSSPEMNINEDKLLGPFFINKKYFADKEKAGEIFKHKVLMYLYEDVAKQLHKRNKLFATQNISYSKLCEDFKNQGINIFNEEIVKVC